MDYFTGILFALISMMAFGLSNTLAQQPVKSIGPYNSTLYRGIVTAIFAIAFLFIMPYSQIDLFFVFIAFLIGILGFIPYYTYLKALDAGKIGIVSTITNSAFLVTVALSVIFYGENVGLYQMLAIALMFFGMATLTIDIGEIKKAKVALLPGTMFALATFFLWGVYFFLIKIPVDYIGPSATLIASEIGVFLPAAIILARKREFRKPDKKTSSFLIANGILLAIAGLSYNLGILSADVSLVSTIARSSPIITLASAWILFREKLKYYQYISIALVISGIAMLMLM